MKIMEIGLINNSTFRISFTVILILCETVKIAAAKIRKVSVIQNMCLVQSTLQLPLELMSATVQTMINFHLLKNLTTDIILQ